LRTGRDEAAAGARDLRQELSLSAKANTDSLLKAVSELGQGQAAHLDAFANRLGTLSASMDGRLDAVRDELRASMKASSDTLVQAVGELGQVQAAQLETFAGRLGAFDESTQLRLDGMRTVIEKQLRATQDTISAAFRDLRSELTASLTRNSDALTQQFTTLTETTQTRLEAVRVSVETQLTAVRETNATELQQIRRTVDEQLQTTLERRLAESFKVVSDHLEAVQRGLGEMKTLATGVGDLQRVLTNVKARGTWAEYQLEAILQEILTSDQYGKNVATRPDSEGRVEFAVRLPGRSPEPGNSLWLPIDSKFPQDPYVRLLTAVEAADPEATKTAVADLAQAIRTQAQSIHDKYVAPPHTTDFAVLFLPTEGLYAEVLRIPGLAASVQHDARVLIAGPTTLAALLSSLRIGFQTLAIERRAGEVWQVLRAVKTEFGRFGDVFAKLRKQLDRATRTIDLADVRTRAMERQLRDVEALPDVEVASVLQLPGQLEHLDDAPVDPFALESVR
jgi:DNA recombination protein RmuC